MRLILDCKMEVNELLNSIYYDVKNPAAFGSIPKLLKAAKYLDPSITLKDVKKWYQKQRINIHKQRKIKIARPKTVIKSSKIQYQTDLMDVSNISDYNDGYKFILVMIDVFSKKGFAVPLKNKTGFAVSKALDKIFKTEPARFLQSDNGREYYNYQVLNVLKKYKIKLFSTQNMTMKATICERWIRTLREKLSKYFTFSGGYNYTKVLDDIVQGYNESVHRSTKFKPNDVANNPLKKVQIRQNLYSAKKFKGFRYNIGDFCRVTVQKSRFAKGSTPNFSEEIFEIVNRKQNGAIATYQLKDLKNNIINSYFTQEELQIVTMPDTFQIDKILDKKTRRNKVYYYVSWLGFPQDQNSWILESQLV